MLFERSTFIGIDPTAGDKPFVYAAMDNELRLLALGLGGIEDVLAFAAGQQQAAIAVCSPQQPNTGVMAKAEYRQNLNPVPSPGRWEDFRLAEYLLRQQGVVIPQTSSLEEKCPRWMRMGFALHRRLKGLDYQVYPADQSPLQVMEVYPQACYTSLLGKAPFGKNTLEGRLQRQLALYDLRLNISDPMNFFEEITRFRLLRGQLPFEHLYSPGELDALVGAYTAWLALAHPEKVEIFGDQTEGQIVVPLS
jgi:hypothetical protein